jgi:hypothetical protein
MPRMGWERGWGEWDVRLCRAGRDMQERIERRRAMCTFVAENRKRAVTRVPLHLVHVAPSCPPSHRHIDALGREVLLGQPICDGCIPVITPQVCIAAGREHLNNTPTHLKP